MADRDEFERTETELIEVGKGAPIPPVISTGDPTGEGDIFLATGVMPFEADGASIFQYVEKRAREVGSYVRKTRGKPPKARPENVLSSEEKAIIILGRAIGVTWHEIKRRITADRIQRGETPFDRANGSLHRGVIVPHKKVVDAIHADILDAIETFSPLVSGSARAVWRAKMIEYYRQRIMVVARHQRLRVIDRERRIIALDRAMSTHMRYFDQMMEPRNIGHLLSSPSSLVHASALSDAEQAIAEQFEEGKITDEERIDALRKLRHGDT